MELRCASSFDCAHEIAAPSASRNAQQDNRRQEQRTKTHGLRRFATNFTSSVAKDSHRCALCLQSRLWGFHRWRAVENMAAKERQNPVPGCSVQVSGLQVGSRVIYLDVLGISWHLGISLRFRILISCFFHFPQPLFGAGKDAASSRARPRGEARSANADELGESLGKSPGDAR